jgi:epoxyqueuosine reductase
MTPTATPTDLHALTHTLKAWARELGFSGVAITDLDMSRAAPQLQEWLKQGFHGQMDYMERHATLRAQPATLVPNAVRAIVVRMDYLDRPLEKIRNEKIRSEEISNEEMRSHEADGDVIDATPTRGVVARYAWGRDYHKVLRARLQQLASRIETEIGAFGYRVFTDSAPVMEVELAQKAGLGWRGKHTLLLNREAGSTFFLGEILTDLPLPIDQPIEPHCGTCTRCIDVCPTRAIIAPYTLDARRCISYLTIELKGSIPVELRPLIGNRVYGCDDCQAVCPWNKYAQVSPLPDFAARHGLDNSTLLDLFAWDEATFLKNTEGSAIRRIGYERWQRNLAVCIGNALRKYDAPSTPIDADFKDNAVKMLMDRRSSAGELVGEHIDWALGDVTNYLQD